MWGRKRKGLAVPKAKAKKFSLKQHREQTMPYDVEHEAKACVNELYYRNGSRPEPLQSNDAEYVRETVLRYLREALKAGAK